MAEYDRYISPFSWRYAGDEMRQIWSETHRRRLWRKLWVALAQAQAELGLVRPEQVEDLRAHAEAVDIPRALEIEAEIHHDLMAEVRAFAEQCPVGRSIIHLGATSMDIEDNADALRLREALDVIFSELGELLKLLAEKIDRTAEIPVIAFTHLQPAEPSTLGYRMAFYAQDLLMDWHQLRAVRAGMKGKGFKGAVGTAASYADLLDAGTEGRGDTETGRRGDAEKETPRFPVSVERVEAFEARLSELLGLPFFPVTNQTYPRKQDYTVVSALAGMAASLYKFAFDLRLLQSPTIGEWSEPFAEKQVGSSAMPFKRNPINAEKIDSLARLLAQMPAVAWNNAAHTLLERTLDDSANRRTLLPETFLISDELLRTALRIVRGLQLNETAIQHNLETYAPFASTERVLMALVRAGADRQEMHERLRGHAMAAWQSVRQNQPNPLAALVAQDAVINQFLPPAVVMSLMQVEGYVGIAPQRAREMAERIREELR